MAQKVQVQFIDDLDGAEADDTVSFALDGVEYEIDLSNDNAIELREILSPYIEHGNRVGGRKKTGRRSTKSTKSKSASTQQSDRERTQAIRTWAHAAGYELSNRGRIPRHIIEAYDAQH